MNSSSIERVITEIRSHTRQNNAPRGLFPASAADRWMACPKSSFLAKEIPYETSVYAEEGKLAHRVCEAVYYHKMHGIPYPKELKKELAEQDDGGAEMTAYGHEYYNIITATHTLCNLGKILYMALEKYMYVDDVRDETRVAGLADCLIIGTDGAAVIDFKYGKGHAVDPGHPQLLTYLTALRGIDVKGYGFYAYIHQPRVAVDFKPVRYSRQALLGHYEKIKEVRQAYQSVNTSLNYGSHCRWCPAKRTNIIEKKCPVVDRKQTDKMWESVQEAVMAMEKAKESSGVDRDERIKQFFAILPMIEEYKKVFEVELLNRLERGDEVKGFKITQRPGRRQWIKEDPEVIEGELKGMHYDELWKKDLTVKKMKPITTIEKWIGKNRLDDYTVMSEPTKKLTVTDEVDIDAILAKAEEEL